VVEIYERKLQLSEKPTTLKTVDTKRKKEMFMRRETNIIFTLLS
jgi:hypothetical protein